MSDASTGRRQLAAGFLISSLLHLGIVAWVLRWAPSAVPGGSNGGQATGLTLAMFESSPGSSGATPEQQTPATAVGARPEAEDEPGLDPVRGPLPKTRSRPGATPALKNDAGPDPSVEPEEDQRPRAKPEVALEQRAGPDPESRTAAEPARRPRREPKPEATGGRATPPASDPDGGRGPVPRAAKSAAKQGAAAARPSPASRGRKQEAAGAPGERSTSGGGRGDGSPTGKKAAERRYLDELQRAIARHRYYPPKARKRDIEGSVTLYFVIHADGRIGDIRVARSSGSRLLDDAGLRTLERLGRFKPIPNSIGRSRWPLRVPISFALK